jgi:hypothetical protein
MADNKAVVPPAASTDARKEPQVLQSGATTNIRIVRIDDGTPKGQLVLTVDLNKALRPASSGKNMLVATSGANMELGQGIGKLGFNLFRPAEGQAEIVACFDAAAKVEEAKVIEDEYKARIAELKARRSA